MALHLETAAINTAFTALRNDMSYDSPYNVTLKLFTDTTLVDSFVISGQDFTSGSGTLYYNNHTLAPLVFTVAPGASDVNIIELVGNFAVGGAQRISMWTLGSTPTDYRPDFPNGGTLKLGQYIMSVTTE